MRLRARSLLALVCLLPFGCDSSAPSDAGTDAGSLADGGATVDAGPAGDTWTNFADEFMQTYCVECHAASPKDFNSLDDVRANAATIRCGTSDVALSACGSFPPPRQFPVGDGPFPSDTDRARLVGWLDAGAPE
ncbi:MAG: hypothetical protein AB7S26_35655 [Sandaracinaceae bacterium]